MNRNKRKTSKNDEEKENRNRRYMLHAAPLLEAAGKGSILVQAVLVGLVSGLLVILFRLGINTSLEAVQKFVYQFPVRERFIIFPLIAMLGGALAGWLVKFAPETKGSGIPYVKMALARMGNVTRIRSIFVKFFAGLVGIGTGLSLGREGPSVQLGAGAGALIGRLFGIKGTAQDKLIAAGAGSAIGATFNAPIAGTVFVVEELVNRFSAGMLLPVLLATVCAASVSRYFLGSSPSFSLPVVPEGTISILPYAILLGVVSGIAGTLFSKTIFLFRGFYARLGFMPDWLKPALAGLVMGIIGCMLPEVLGPGNTATDALFSGRIALGAAVVIFCVKFIVTPLCFGSGAAGGIFLPMLMLGAFLGWICGLALTACGAVSADPAALSLMGMAAFLSAVGRTPITAVVMVFEMTGGYGLILPMMLCAAVADFTAERLGQLPVYSMLVMRGDKTGSAQVLSSLKVKEYMVKGNPIFEPERTVDDALYFCRSNRTTTLTICDKQRHVLGTVSWPDLEDYKYQGNSGKDPLAKVFNPAAELIFPEEDLYSAYYRLHSSGGGALVVVDHKMRVQGLVTRKELGSALSRNYFPFMNAGNKKEWIEKTADSVISSGNPAGRTAERYSAEKHGIKRNRR